MSKKDKGKKKTRSEAVQAPELVSDATTPKKKEKTVQPDRWLVTPVSYEEDGTENPSELIFYRGDKTLVKMAVTKENFGELLEVLQIRFGESTITPEEWHVRVPPTENGELGEPVLSFSSRSRILLTLPMSQEFLKKFTKTLNGYIIKPEPTGKILGAWWQKHKFWRVVITIAILPLLFAFLLALGFAGTH